MSLHADAIHLTAHHFSPATSRTRLSLCLSVSRLRIGLCVSVRLSVCRKHIGRGSFTSRLPQSFINASRTTVMTKFVQWPLIADSIRSMQQRSIARRRCTKRHTTLARRNASRLEITTGMGMGYHGNPAGLEIKLQLWNGNAQILGRLSVSIPATKTQGINGSVLTTSNRYAG